MRFEVFKLTGHGICHVELERMVRIRVGGSPDIVAIALFRCTGDNNAVNTFSFKFDRTAVFAALGFRPIGELSTASTGSSQQVESG